MSTKETPRMFGNLRKMHSLDGTAEDVAKKSAVKIADPEPKTPSLVVAAFQSSI